KISIPLGVTSVTKKIKIKVRNADILPIPETPGHVTQLLASNGDCPAGTVSTPDFNTAVAGAQDFVQLAGGRTKKGLVTLTISSAAFNNFNRPPPKRCTPSFTAAPGGA